MYLVYSAIDYQRTFSGTDFITFFLNLIAGFFSRSIFCCGVILETFIIIICAENISYHINDILFYIFRGTGNIFGNGFLILNDTVNLLVNGTSAEEIVTGYRILLPYTMRTVFALATIGISPGNSTKATLLDAVRVSPTPAALMEQMIISVLGLF